MQNYDGILEVNHEVKGIRDEVTDHIVRGRRNESRA